MKRVAISLGASFMGYATHAGFLARLQALGVKPVALAGSSAGAITAGMHAAGLSVEKIRDEVLGTRLPMSFITYVHWLWRMVGDICTSRQPAFFTAEAAVTYFEDLLGQRRIEEMSEPSLMIGLTDLATSEAIFARNGPLAEAMVASSAVPLIFKEQAWDGRRVVDGGVAHEAPVDPWFDESDIELIIIHRIVHPRRPRPWFVPQRIMHVLSQAHECMNVQALADRVKLARFHGKELRVVTTTVDVPSIWSRKSRERCYAAGEATAEALGRDGCIAGLL